MPFQVNIKGTLKTLTRSSHVTPCGLEHNTRKHASKTTFASVFNPSFHMEFFLSFLNFTVKTFIYTEKYIEMIVQSISIYTLYLDSSVVSFGYTYFVFPLQTHVCVLSHISYVWLFANLWTVACEAPLSMGFSRQEHWCKLSFSPPGDLPDPGVKLHFLCFLNWQVSSLPLVLSGKLLYTHTHTHTHTHTVGWYFETKLYTWYFTS